MFVHQLSDAAPPVGQHQPAPAPGSSSAKRIVRDPGDAGLRSALDELATPVDGGHLVTTSLLSIFITNDNRLLIGAVSPQYLEHVAATSAGQ